MIPYEEALARLLALAAPAPAECIPLFSARGRVPVAALSATRTQPPFAASAMDGYAIRSADWPGPFRLAGATAAGEAAAGPLGAREAVRIFTGAPLPDGADAVLIQEDARPEPPLIHAREPASATAPGQHVRAAGVDVRPGDVVAAAGVPLAPARLGLLAAAGHGAVEVTRRPRVALLATGDELVPPGTTPGPGQIVECNRAALGPLLGRLADVIDLGIARDDPADLARAIAAGRGADVLVTIGGASVGDHDLVRPALAAAGAEIDFWRVAIRPGKPVMAGRLGSAVVLGLPGNPASAFVTALLLLLPLVRHIGGHADPGPRSRQARLGADLPANGPRRDHLRATLRQEGAASIATPLGRQDSSLISVMAAAQALIVRPIGAAAARAGEMVEILDTDSCES